MKIAKQDYELLQSKINSLLSQYSKEQILKHRTTIKFANCQFTSFCWSIFHQVYKDVKHLYTYLNDSHIETALKSILDDYKTCGICGDTGKFTNCFDQEFDCKHDYRL